MSFENEELNFHTTGILDVFVLDKTKYIDQNISIKTMA